MNWIWTAVFIFVLLLSASKIDEKSPPTWGPCAVLIIDP